MKSLIVVTLFLVCASHSFACSGYWNDETGNFPTSSLYWNNPIAVYDIDPWLVTDAFGRWEAQIEAVSDLGFTYYVDNSTSTNYVGGEGESDCSYYNGVPLGCTFWDISSYDDRIECFDIEINITNIDHDAIDWTFWSMRAVMTHEAGHAVGMWHAFAVCPNCTGEDLPTMMPCYGTDQCEGCGNLLTSPLAITLSSIDVAEVRYKYEGRTVGTEGDYNNPGDQIPNEIERNWGISNYPNPFNPMTTIEVTVPHPTRVS